MENENMIKEIYDRLEALGQTVSEERIKEIVQTCMADTAQGEKGERKMRFAPPDGDRLQGSKYARFGLKTTDVEWLHQILSAAKVAGRGRGPSEMLTSAVRDVSQARYAAPADYFEDSAHTRAMDTATTLEGAELIGAGYIGELWDAARAQSLVAGLIGSFEMRYPTEYLPVEVDFPALLHLSESTSSTITAITTSETASNRVSVTAHKFGIHQMWSGEMEEDSIIPFVPFLRGQAEKSLAFHMDGLALNGDTTSTNGINGIDDVLTSAHYSAAFDGIRHAALVDNTANKVSAAAANISLALFRPIYGRMIDVTYKHDWGHPNNPADLVHVVDPYTADAMMMLDEFLTADKAGDQATNLKGQISKVFGHPVLSSIALRLTTNNGYVDDDTETNNIYGQIVSFNKNGLKWGWRRRVKVEVEREAQSDQSRIVYTLRLGLARFYPAGAASGIEWADNVYYIAL